MKEWKAKWIMFETCPENVTPVFRRIFSLTKRPESASIDICGLGFYYLKINGWGRNFCSLLLPLMTGLCSIIPVI